MNTAMHDHHGHNHDENFDMYLPAKNAVADQFYHSDPPRPKTIDDALQLKRDNGTQAYGAKAVRSYYLERVNIINLQQALMGVQQTEDMPAHGRLATLR